MGAVISWALGLVLRHFGVAFLATSLVRMLRRIQHATADNPALWTVILSASAKAEIDHPGQGMGTLRYELVVDAARAWLGELAADLRDVAAGTIDDLIQQAWSSTQALVDEGRRDVLDARADLLARYPQFGAAWDAMEGRPIMRDPVTGEHRLADKRGAQ